MDAHGLMSAVCSTGLAVIVILETDLPVKHADLDAVREVILVARKGRWCREAVPRHGVSDEHANPASRHVDGELAVMPRKVLVDVVQDIVVAQVVCQGDGLVR